MRSEPLARPPLARPLAAARDDLQRGHRGRAVPDRRVDRARRHVLAAAEDRLGRGQLLQPRAGDRRGRRGCCAKPASFSRRARSVARSSAARGALRPFPRGGGCCRAAAGANAWAAAIRRRARPRPGRGRRRRCPRPRRRRRRRRPSWPCRRRGRRRRRAARSRARGRGRPRAGSRRRCRPRRPRSVRSRPLGAQFSSASASVAGLHSALALGADDHLAPGDPADPGAVGE